MHLAALKTARTKLLNDRESGSITLFLSMVLILILALTGTLLEGARLRTIKGTGREALMTAMDGVLTQYYRPLYDDYHLFFMRGEAETEEMQKEILFAETARYLQALSPDEDKKANLLSFSVSGGETEKIIRAAEQEYGLFMEEAAAYMKYLCPASLLEDFTGQKKQLTETEHTSGVLEKKQEAEGKLGELNRDILEIIELVEGLSVNRKGIQFYKNGKIKTEKNFVKQLSPGGIHEKALGIRHPDVWEALKSRYINPVEAFRRIAEAVERIREWEDEISGLEEKRDSPGQIEKSGENIHEKQEETDGQIAEINRRIQKKLSSVSKEKKYLTGTAKKLIKKIEKASGLISGLKQKQEEAGKSLESFRSFLEKEKGELNGRTYEGLLEERKAMERYASSRNDEEGKQSDVSRIVSMKPVLLSNKTILTEWSRFEKMPVIRDAQALAALLQEAERLSVQAAGYETASLVFDYEGLVCKPDTKDPASILRGLLGVDLLTMLIPEGGVSEKKIRSTDRLSGLWGHESREIGMDYGGILNKEDEECQKEIKDSFGKNGTSLKAVEQMEDLQDRGFQQLLLWEYAKEHLKRYTMESQQSEGTKAGETALLYEQEYVIAGRDSDEENIRAVTDTILFMRTICNFIAILGDKEKENKAYITAAALVGFTGLEPLVRLARTLILVVWGFEEGLVDTAVLLRGEKVPLLKDSKAFSMDFQDLLSLNRELLQRKAKEYKYEGKKYGGFSYDDYLRLFFLMRNKEQSCGRMMDLIQENVRLRYDKSFSMERCIFGFRAQIEYKIAPRFLSLPFIRPYGKTNMFTDKIALDDSY